MTLCNICYVSRSSWKFTNSSISEFAQHFQQLSHSLRFGLRRKCWKFKFYCRHNQRFAAGLETFDVSINYFADWFSDEIAKFASGAQKEPYDFNQMVPRPKTALILNRTDIPTGPPSIDWNAQGSIHIFERLFLLLDIFLTQPLTFSGHVTPVKDQGK